MIEREGTELRGQMEIGDMMERQGETRLEGYDEEGRLLADVMGYEGAAREGAIARSDRGGTENESVDRLAVLAGEINAIGNHARVVLASAAMDIGKRLIEARGLVPRGRWKEWLETNIDYSERRAQQLMQLYDEFGDRSLPGGYSGLGLSQMTALLAAPEDERDALAQRAADEGLSVRELRREIEALRAERDLAQTRIDDLAQDNSRLSGTISDYETRLDDESEAARAAEARTARAVEAQRVAEAKAAAAEAAAEQLRRMHGDAEDRAAQTAQQASDAVTRANRTAKELAEARRRIAELEGEMAAKPAHEPATVEVVPEAVTRELEELRAQLAEALAARPAGAAVEITPETGTATAVARFQDCYKRLSDEFKRAEALLAEITREDAHTGHTYATALVKSCRMVAARLGEEG